MKERLLELKVSKKTLAIAILFSCHIPMANAAISCNELKANSSQYQARMDQLAKLANLPGGSYLRHHEQVVANFCAGNADATKALVQQRYVRQGEVTAIERQLQMDQPSDRQASVTSDNDSASIEKVVDAFFSRWAQSWMIDRYVSRSSRVTEMKMKDGSYLVRGEFKFARGGGVASIPFSAVLQKPDGNFRPVNLCYNDTTSGMTDCADSSTDTARRQFMRAIILTSVVAALSNSGTSYGPVRGGDYENYRAMREDDERREKDNRYTAEQQRRDDRYTADQQRNEEWARARQEDGDRAQRAIQQSPGY